MSVAAMTTSVEKYGWVAEVVNLTGVPLLLEQLIPPSGIEEPVDTDPQVVGYGKLKNQILAIQDTDEWYQRKCESGLPKALMSVDVLPVVHNLRLPKSQAVLKKPEGDADSALGAVTEFFALCIDEMKDQGQEELELVYYLIMGGALVDTTSGKIQPKSHQVLWDQFTMIMSRGLVEKLAKPKFWRGLSRDGHGVARVLTNSSVVGMRLAELTPIVASHVAGANASDKLEMKLQYGRQIQQIDNHKDLPKMLRVGREGDRVQEVAITDFLKWATHNVTPRLVLEFYNKLAKM